MAELIRTFTGGAMNKDLDERLVPNGQYRDALNINVSGSEGSDSGALKNVKGNLEQKNESLNSSTGAYTEWSTNYIDTALQNPICIGSIAESVNEKIYWYIASDNISVIAEYDKNTEIVKPILVDTQNILNFSKDYLITGINIIEGLLFWTDNKKEPKSINIKDWANSTPNFATHSQIYGRSFIERDVVVIKPAPLKQPILTLSKNLGVGSTTSTAVFNFIEVTTPPVASGSIGDSIPVGTSVSITLGSPINVLAGNTLNFTCDTPSSEGYNPVDGEGTEQSYNFTVSVVTMTGGGTVLNGVIQSGTAQVISGTFDYEVSTAGERTLFDLKFPRFGYRYKYQGNQYSPFSPFSEVAFLPSNFEYNSANGYNLGMTNSVKRIILGGFDSPIPADVLELDILYKEDNSTAVYKVESLSPEDLSINYIEYGITNNSNATVSFDFTNTKKDTQQISVFPTQTVSIIAQDGTLVPSSTTDVVITPTSLGTVFEVLSELIYSLLPSNQILRPWDNVPRQAKSQEAISNRIIYGNYLQNYNVSSYIKFDTANTIVAQAPVLNVNSPSKSIKSLRTYQIGIVFKDKYGRETPVFTDPSGVIDVTNSLSDTANSLKLKVASLSPKNTDGSEMFDSFKIFIKDPAAEYYNAVADRLYESEDGESVWVSLPSAETNKIMEGEFVVLKKRNDAPVAVQDYPLNKFKVLSKQSEAPDELVKTTRAISSLNYAFDEQFGTGDDATYRIPGATPVAGYNQFFIAGQEGKNGVGAATIPFWVVGNKIRFTDRISTTQYYEIESVEFDPSGANELRVTITTPFTTDVNFLYEDPTALTSPLVSVFNTIEIANEFETLGKGQFEGRFFIRLQKTPTLMDNFVSDVELIPAATTIVSTGYDADRYAIYSTGGGALQNAAGSQIGSATRLPPPTNRNYGGGDSGGSGSVDGGNFGSLWNIPYQPGEWWDLVFERKVTSRGSGAFGKAYKVGEKIRFSTHPAVYEIKFIYEYTVDQRTDYVRSYTRLDRPLEASVSPFHIKGASFTNGNIPVYVDGVEIFAGGLTAMPFVTVDILKPADVREITSAEPAIFETEPAEQVALDIYYEISDAIPIAQYNDLHLSPWFNCYTFGNGVESNRIRDDYNASYIRTGTKANAVLDLPYTEERLSNNLIFSGIFNSTSGVNQLNQFIQAEAITKSLDPQSGPIQKLFARETDLLAFCEDKVVKILADKDALYNADGNSQLTASNNVLGQAIIPSSFGMFGIGKHPESFASYGYRAYFADGPKGKVLRLSADGVTPISNYGMDDFFQDNLPLNNKIIGFYDNSNGTYNVSLNTLDSESIAKYGNKTTISFNESSNGWSSRKSYVPENGVSIDTKLYSFNEGLIWEHGKNSLYNNFYGVQYNSYVTLLFNEEFNTVKGFKTLNYTGTESKKNIYKTATTGEQTFSLAQIQAQRLTPSSVTPTEGWSVTNAKTNLDTGNVPEFINKEGKYFNYIKGDTTNISNISTENFSVQGIGRASSITGDAVSSFNVRIFADPSCFTNTNP